MRINRVVIISFMMWGLVTSAGPVIRDTPHTITFDNQSGKNAVVKLIGPSKHQIHVPDGQQRSVRVSPGIYYTLTRFGSNEDRYVYEKGDSLTVSAPVGKHVEISITLHKVEQGNYRSNPIRPEEFDQVEIESRQPVLSDTVPPQKSVPFHIPLPQLHQPPPMIKVPPVRLPPPGVIESGFESIEISEYDGVIAGKLVWEDGAPVQTADVKLTNKIITREVPNRMSYAVQRVTIPLDAATRNASVDNDGKFRFEKLPPGDYFIILRVPLSVEGVGWFYQYHKSSTILYWEGHMMEPDKHHLEKGQTLNLPQIVLKKAS